MLEKATLEENAKYVPLKSFTILSISSKKVLFFFCEITLGETLLAEKLVVCLPRTQTSEKLLNRECVPYFVCQYNSFAVQREKFFHSFSSYTQT